jgi:hypothetical protein
MSRIAELTQEVNDLQNRVSVLEAALLRLLEKSGIQDHTIGLHDIGEVRQPIGYKIPKKKPTR